jgi:hypothetical protein
MYVFKVIDTIEDVMKVDHNSYRLVDVFGIAQLLNNGKPTWRNDIYAKEYRCFIRSYPNIFSALLREILCSVRLSYQEEKSRWGTDTLP